MPQAAQIKPVPSTGATPQPRSAPLNKPANDTYPATGATQQQNPAAESSTPKQKQPREFRVNDTNMFLMIGVAVLLDLIGLIPVVGGYAAEILGALTFILWFLILSLPLMSPKTVANWALNLIVGESVTAGVWPGFTIGIILTIVMARFEDKTGLDAMGLMKGDVKSVADIGKNLSEQVRARAGGGGGGAVGATPPPKPQIADGTAKTPHPVTASQQEHFADPSKPVAQGATPRTPKSQEIIDARPGAQEAQNLERAIRDQQNNLIDIRPGAQEAQNLERAIRNQQNNLIDIRPGAQEARNLERALGNKVVPFPGSGSPNFGRGSRYEERGGDNGKTDSMSVHDELWELNTKPDLDQNDKERLQKAHWIMEHNQIEEKEKSDPVLLRAWERAQRGEVAFDGSPEKRHGFIFKNVQIVNGTHTATGRDVESLNPRLLSSLENKPSHNTGATPIPKPVNDDVS